MVAGGESCVLGSSGKVTEMSVPDGVEVKCTLPRCSITRS